MDAILLLGIITPAFASNLAVQTSWFTPVLTENNDPACYSLLADAQRKFNSDTAFGEAYGVEGHGYSKTARILGWKIEGGRGRGEITAYGKTYYLDYLRRSGCGGACETNQPLVSDNPIPAQRDEAYLETLARDAPPAESYEYTIARRSADDVYLFVVETTNRRIVVYRLAREGRWRLACNVATAPERLTELAPFSDEKVIGSLQALEQRVFDLLRPGGNCGSAVTHWRWKREVHDALQTALYRPWALRERQPGADADGSYQNDMSHLAQWSLLGTYQYEAYQAFLAHLADTTHQLGAFYQKANGWSEETSERMAADALRGAVSTGIRFHMYDPQFARGERLLRKAILEKQKIGDIRAITFDARGIDATLDQWAEDPGAHDSILSIAVNYPEALELLLQSGVANDHINDFGKTPLMYAVQNNQVEAVRLLIKAGADTNATTTKPLNTCYYSLQTFNMTPLHYAVRYASPDIIRLLLDNGAQPFIKAENFHEYPAAKESPLDWLHRYTAPNAAERNPHISDRQLDEIEEWLAPPIPEQAAEKARTHVLVAEELYQKGHLMQAYREIALAAQLLPDDQRTLSDLSLIALKNGKLGESVRASKKLIDGPGSDKMRANAWFNLGLACEKHRADSPHGYLTFDGDTYCTYGTLHSYVKAYELAPTDGRKEKLIALFDKHLVPYCQIPVNGKSIKINFQFGSNPDSKKRYGQLQTLYVLHDKMQPITSENLAWDVRFQGEEAAHVAPEKTGSLELDGKVLSVFETSISSVNFPYSVLGATCTHKESMQIAPE